MVPDKLPEVTQNAKGFRHANVESSKGGGGICRLTGEARSILEAYAQPRYEGILAQTHTVEQPCCAK